MAPDDRTALLAEYPQNEFERSLALMSEEQRKIARSLLQFPEKSVGRLMTPDYIAARDTGPFANCSITFAITERTARP